MALQLSKTIIFEVHYYASDAKFPPKFTTEAERFMRNKKDFERCGQCQSDLLSDYHDVMAFYRKWDDYHLKPLSEEAYRELATDIAVLGTRYNYMLKQHINGKTVVGGYSFDALKELSMMTPKSSLKTAKAKLKQSEASEQSLHYVNRPISVFFNN